MIRFILLLALLTAFPALSTDMYLPAIPFLQKIWNKPLSVVNLSLVLFFIAYCVFLLVYGPLSDKYGRKPPLIAGIIAYIAGCILCSFSLSVEMLILARILQAAGAASAPSIAMAMAKDRLETKQREKILGYISVIMALAPMAAPMVGSIIIVGFSWHWIFIFQAFMGIIALVGVLYTKESNFNPSGVGFGELIKSYIRILKNSKFMLVVVCTSFVGVPFFGFVASSSDIYMSHFGVSESVFAAYYAANSFCFMIGAIVCARFGRRMGSSVMLSSGFAGIGLGGVIMASGLISGPFALTIPMGIVSFCLGISRPPANNLALEQVKEDAGAASSLLIFIYFILGSAGMAVASLDWNNKVGFLGLLSILSGIITSVLWIFAKSKIEIPY